jgi:hypothetical protein
MYPQRRRTVRHAFGLGLLVALLLLALSACGGGGGGGEEEAKVHHIPEDEKALPPGQYHTQEFRPSASFRLDKGWYSEAETSDSFAFSGDMGQIGFSRIPEVFKPGTVDVVEAPKDMVSWFQQHPYLQADKPEPVTVGGVKGKQFNLVVAKDRLEQDRAAGVCGVDCVDIYRLSSGETISFFKEEKVRIIVLEDVKGETVTIDFESLIADFEEFAPKAEKVLDSVEWTDS